MPVYCVNNHPKMEFIGFMDIKEETGSGESKIEEE